MKEYRPAYKGVYVLRIWAVLIALLLSLLSGVIAAFSITAGVILFLLVAALTLTTIFFVIPEFIKNKRIEISGEKVVISGGIIYKHNRIIKREKLIYISRVKSPIAALFGVCSIRLSTAGSVFLIPLLSCEESEELMLLI